MSLTIKNWRLTSKFLFHTLNKGDFVRLFLEAAESKRELGQDYEAQYGGCYQPAKRALCLRDGIFKKRVEAAPLSLMAEFRSGNIEGYSAEGFGVIEHALRWYKKKFRLFVDEPGDELWAGNSIDLGAFSGDPFRGWSPSLMRSTLLHIHFVDGGSKSICKLHGIRIGPEVHEKHMRIVIDHVAMKSRDLDAMVMQRMQHRVDFL